MAPMQAWYLVALFPRGRLQRGRHGRGLLRADDADGIVGVDITVALTVDDTVFAPAIVKTQNSSVVADAHEPGDAPARLRHRLPGTPNSRGCPAFVLPQRRRRCPPSRARRERDREVLVPPSRGSAYRSTADGDAALGTGQFILQ